MSNYLPAFFKATGRAGLDEKQIMHIARTKYAKIDLRMDPQFTKRETFQISDEMTEAARKAMDEYGMHNLPPKLKARLEDFAAKAVAFGDDQQTLRHTNAFLKFSDDIYGPGGANNVTSMVPDQLARQAHKQSVQAADSTYGDFPGRQEMIKKNIQRLIQERPEEVDVLRNYLNSGYDGTYAEYLRNEVDSEKWMNYMNIFPEGYGAGDFAAGGRVGAMGGGLIRELLKKLLGGAKGQGVGSLMKPKVREGIVPPGMMQEAGVHQKMMQEPGWYRDRILGESKMDEAMLNLGEATKHRTGWQPDPLNPVIAKRHREAFAKPKEEGIMQVSKIDEEVNEMLTEMRAMKDKSKTMMTEAEFKLGEMNAKDSLVDDMVREMDEGVHPRVALQRFLAAYNKLTRPQHAAGGRVGMWGGGLLKKLVGTALNPKLEKQLMTPKLNLGQTPAAIGDMEQIKNVIRNPDTDLPAIYELEDMIQNSTRYSDQQKQLFLRLIQKEKIRADVLWDNPKAQKMAEQDPEGFDAILEQMMKEGGGDFATGGRVGLHEGGMLGSMGVEDGSYQAAQQAAAPNHQINALQGFASMMPSRGQSYMDALGPQGHIAPELRTQQEIPQKDLTSLPGYMPWNAGMFNNPPMGSESISPGNTGLPAGWTKGSIGQLPTAPKDTSPVSNRQLGEKLTETLTNQTQTLGGHLQSSSDRILQAIQQPSGNGSQYNQPINRILSGIGGNFGGNFGGGIGNLFGTRS